MRHSRARHHVHIAIMSATLLACQGCLFRGSKTNSPVEPASPVSIAVLPLNVREQPQSPASPAQAAGNGRQNQATSGGRARPSSAEPTLQSMSIASAVVATSVLQGIPGIEPVPMWRALQVASTILNNTRWVTPSMAAELANMLSVRWTMMGEISPASEGYNVIIDFIPSKPAVFPFRYQKVLRRELLSQRLGEALEEFLRYAGHPVPQLRTLDRGGDWSELSRLVEAVDREYGWFSPPAPGNSQAAYAAIFTRDPRLASLLFNPDRYSAASAPAPSQASKPSTTSVAEPIAKAAPVVTNPINAVPDRRQPKQPIPLPTSPMAGIPEISKWTSLTVSPVLSLPAEQQLHSGQATAAVHGRTSSMLSTPGAGYLRESGSTVLPYAPGARYVLQLFASTNETDARRVAQELLRGGAPAKVSASKTGSETIYRVNGGTYDSPAAASAAGDALITLRMASEYWIRTESAPVATASREPAAEPPRAADAAGSTAGSFQVQVFASSDREKAVALAEELRQIGLRAQVEPFKLTGKGDWYRVRLSGYPSRKEALAAAEKLRSEGRIREYWIVG